MTTTRINTNDIVFAAYLKLIGYTIKKIDVVRSNIGYFDFGDVNNLDIETFDYGNARVEPSAFNHAIRQLTTSVRREIATQNEAND